MTITTTDSDTFGDVLFGDHLRYVGTPGE